MAFHPPGEIHWDHFFAPGVRDLNIEIEPDLFSILGGYSDFIDHSVASCDFEPRWLAAKVYREFSHFDELSALAIEGLVIELLVELSRKHLGEAARPPIWLKKAREIIQARFTERLSLAELSSIVGVHPVHLAREFRRGFHCTIGEEMRRLRIELACRELANRGRALDDVALITGFSDQSHFGKAFKKITGMTPLEFQGLLGTSFRNPYPLRHVKRIKAND